MTSLKGDEKEEEEEEDEEEDWKGVKKVSRVQSKAKELCSFSSMAITITLFSAIDFFHNSDLSFFLYVSCIYI